MWEDLNEGRLGELRSEHQTRGNTCTASGGSLPGLAPLGLACWVPGLATCCSGNGHSACLLDPRAKGFLRDSAPRTGHLQSNQSPRSNGSIPRILAMPWVPQGPCILPSIRFGGQACLLSLAPSPIWLGYRTASLGSNF